MGLTSTQKKENNIVEITVSVGAEELKEATDKVFKKKVKSLSVPGFRKGKAPRQIIEKMYGEGIFMEDAVNELYPKAYSDAVDEAGIDPVDRADVEILSLDKNEGFTFKATVTVKPEVELGQYKGIKMDKIVYTVSDADVDAEIERMRERNARIVSASDRDAKNGDEVVIDFEGFVDGEAFEGGKAEGYNITLGSNSFIDTFEKQIEGHRPGDEFDVNVTFPEEYHAENLKGKPALFKVKLSEIKEKELPALDDEFAKDVSEFDTVDELKADIRKKQEESKKARTDDEFENKLLDEIIKDMKADIPEVMTQNSIDNMVKDFEYRISQQGMNMQMYLQYTGMDMDAFRASFMEPATRQVKVRLALEKVGELEKFEATPEDIASEYERIAKIYNMDADKVKGFIPEKEVAADWKSTKALDLIRDSAQVTEKAPEAAPEKASEEAKTEEKPKKAAAKKPAAKKPVAKKTKKADEEKGGE